MVKGYRKFFFGTVQLGMHFFSTNISKVMLTLSDPVFCSLCASILNHEFSRILLFKVERHCHPITCTTFQLTIFRSFTTFWVFSFLAPFVPPSSPVNVKQRLNYAVLCHFVFSVFLLTSDSISWKPIIYRKDYQPTFFTWEKRKSGIFSELFSDEVRREEHLWWAQHGTSRHL